MSDTYSTPLRAVLDAWKPTGSPTDAAYRLRLTRALSVLRNGGTRSEAIADVSSLTETTFEKD